MLSNLLKPEEVTQERFEELFSIEGAEFKDLLLLKYYYSKDQLLLLLSCHSDAKDFKPEPVGDIKFVPFLLTSEKRYSYIPLPRNIRVTGVDRTRLRIYNNIMRHVLRTAYGIYNPFYLKALAYQRAMDRLTQDDEIYRCPGIRAFAESILTDINETYGRGSPTSQTPPIQNLSKRLERCLPISQTPSKPDGSNC